MPGVDKTPHNSSGKSIPVIINPRDNQEAPKPNKSNKHNVKTIKRSNKIVEALQLPTIMNVNPRSVYNKIIEFHTFVEEEGIECVFMSESWERPDKPLEEIIELPNFTIISNPHQRKGIGGRPALIINTEKYTVKNITQSLIEIPWGVEAVWAILTPKLIMNNSKIKKIALCSFYSKPKSRMKSVLLDHINQAFNIISSKYGDETHFIIAGDSNDLKLENILNLSTQFKQLVKEPTRLNPPRMLDPIITTLGSYYQTPIVLPPLDPDPDTNGVPADHLIGVMKPINNINSQASRAFKHIKVRPITQLGLKNLQSWIENETWQKLLSYESVDKKAELLQKTLLEKIDEYCPEKIRKISSDDKPWFTEDLKNLDRKKRREYRKNRRSSKYNQLKKLFDKKVAIQKKKFKIKMIGDVVNAKSSQWYSKLKRIANYDQEKKNIVDVEEISHLSNKAQAEAIADSFSKISNEYDPIKKENIEIPPFKKTDVPKISHHKVKQHLQQIKTNKATVPGDVPAKIIKELAPHLAVPVTDIINTAIVTGQWPKLYKIETITPIPKEYPPETCELLRPISGLLNFDKIIEEIISEMVISDMKPNIDPKQFGNQKNLGIEHYLVRLLHRILSSTDNNSRGEVNAVLCLFVDWKQAFSRQCHTLGIKSFLKNGVRASLIPLLISYFEDRQMRVKWRENLSDLRKLPGGGAMGATLGIWEFLSQTNNSADCVPVEDRFKFVDDLTTLEVINLLNIGIEQFDILQNVPSDIPTSNQFIDPRKLKSQEYLDKLTEWSENQKMVISQKKTKALLFNFTDNYQFGTRLKLKNENIEIVNKIKLLGTTINDKLSWDDNCSQLISAVNKRMQLIRTMKSFGATIKELVHLWILYCRSLLEKSCVLWHSLLTKENLNDLERTQKTFTKLILQNKYKTYEEALIKLNLVSLADRRQQLCLKFAESGIRHNKLNDLLKIRKKKHGMKTRKSEKYEIKFSNTERWRKSSIIYLQSLLNQD